MLRIQPHWGGKPVMDNMTHDDYLLPNKTYVRGVEINSDSVVYAEDFIFEYDNVVKATMGGHAIVMAFHLSMVCLAAWHNNGIDPLQEGYFHSNSEKMLCASKKTRWPYQPAGFEERPRVDQSVRIVTLINGVPTSSAEGSRAMRV
jgi:hypothetical protein